MDRKSTRLFKSLASSTPRAFWCLKGRRVTDVLGLKGLALALLLAPFVVSPSFANVCQQEAPPKALAFTPNYRPSYWVMVSPDGNFLAYMTVAGNYLIDMSDKGIGAMLPAPGKVDLQFSEDQTYFTLVNKHRSEAKRLSFGVDHGTSWYSFDELLSYFDRSQKLNPPTYDRSQFPNKKRTVKRLAIDRTFFNHYHSMGTYLDAGGVKWHRVMNDYRGASYRDYRFENDELVSGKIVYITSSPDLTDKYGNSFIDLPMLSRDSQYFAGYNRETMSTQVYAIEPNEQKRLALDIGMEGGKVAFSYPVPGSPYLYMAYHVDLVVHEEGNKMSGAMIGRSKDILVLKLKRIQDDQGKEYLKRLGYAVITRTGLVGEGNYYPQWSRDGHLYFVQVKQNGAKDYHFIKTDPKDYVFQPFNLPSDFDKYATSCGKKRFHAMVAIGMSWAKQCSSYSTRLSARDAAIKSIGLPQKTCEALVESWQTQRPGIVASQRLYSERTPHSRGGGIRPDGRWTAKGAKRLPVIAEKDLLLALTQQDLLKACEQSQLEYQYICPTDGQKATVTPSSL